MGSPADTGSVRLRRSRTTVIGHALVLAAGLSLLVSACSGGSSSDAQDATTTTTTASTSEVPTYVDPAVPITAEVGREFAIMLPADPGSGWRWILTPIDNSRLVALGSRFSDDAALLARAETATTTTTTIASARAQGATTTSTTTTTTPVVLPLVQIVGFAGRSPGPASLTFSYTQIAGATQTAKRTVTFTVQVVPLKPTTTTSSTTTSTTSSTSTTIAR